MASLFSDALNVLIAGNLWAVVGMVIARETSTDHAAVHIASFFPLQIREVNRGNRITHWVLLVTGIPGNQTAAVVEFDETGIGIVPSAGQAGNFVERAGV